MRIVHDGRDSFMREVVGLMRHLVSVSYRWLVCLAYAGGVAYLSLAPSDRFQATPDLLPHLDKAVHFILYGIFAGLLVWAARTRMRGLWALCFGLAVGYGVAMEWGQVLFASDRHFSLLDIAANTLGAGSFVGLYAMTQYWWNGGKNERR